MLKYFKILYQFFLNLIGNPNMYLNIDRFEIILFLISIDTSFANDYVHDHERVILILLLN